VFPYLGNTFEIATSTCVGSFCHLVYDLDCHSYLYPNSPSGSLPQCFLLGSFAVFDPEISLTIFEKHHIGNIQTNINCFLKFEEGGLKIDVSAFISKMLPKH
jgi:hypothetical protein